MKKSNKKGFTIVELVIVIAVIAILAAVLIPTFSNVISKANDSAALQNARNTYTEYIAGLGAGIPASLNYVVEGKSGSYTKYFAVKDGSMINNPQNTADAAAKLINESYVATLAENTTQIYTVAASTTNP